MEKTNKQQKRKSSKRVSSIIGIVICVILVPILLMNLTIIVKSYINPDAVPDFFGIKPFVVLSGSMEPEILVGDLVIVQNVDPANLKANDVISFRDGESVVTHRIMELTETEGAPAFITRGDANNSDDTKPVTYEQVEGIYLFKINGVGNLAMFMQTPMGLLVFVGIPLCAFILYDILRRKFEDSKGDKKYNDAQAEIERLKAELEQKSSTEE